MNILGAGLGRFAMEVHEDPTAGIHRTSWLAAGVSDAIWSQLGRLQVKGKLKAASS
jgi:hypothetical protein